MRARAIGWDPPSGDPNRKEETMTRILKALGLALVAVFALSAVAASTASAQQGTLTSDGPVTLTATETGVGQNWFEAFAAKIECPGSTFTGHKVATTPHTPISSGATEATLTPIWKETVGGAPQLQSAGPRPHGDNRHERLRLRGRKLGGTTGGEITYGVKFSRGVPRRQTNRGDMWTGSHANPTFCSIDVPERRAPGPERGDTSRTQQTAPGHPGD